MSSRDEWYRSDDWSSKAQQLFETKIKRARTSYNKAQYTYLKALSLLRTKDSLHRDAAIELLKNVTKHYPEECHAGMAYEELGQIYEEDGQWIQAEKFYHEAIKTQEGSCIKGCPEFRLALLIVNSGRISKYKEAEDLLSAVEKSNVAIMVLNSYRFDFYVARAKLAEEQGEHQEAVSYARIALELAETKEPQLPHKPEIGIVEANPEKLEAMHKIVTGNGFCQVRSIY